MKLSEAIWSTIGITVAATLFGWMAYLLGPYFLETVIQARDKWHEVLLRW